MKPYQLTHRAVVIVGRFATGKSSCCQHLSECFANAQVYVNSDVLKAALQPFNREALGREDYSGMGTFAWKRWGNDAIVRAHFGAIRQVIVRQNEAWDGTDIQIMDTLSIIDGCRHPDELTAVRVEMPETLVIGLVADLDRRLMYENDRRRERGQPRIDADELAKLDALPSEVFVNRCLSMADFVIENNGDRQMLLENINNIVQSSEPVENMEGSTTGCRMF